MAYKYKLGKVEIIKIDGVDNRLSVFVHCADDATGMETKQEYIIEKSDIPGWDKKLTEGKVKAFMKGYLSEVVIPAQIRLDQLAAQIPTPPEAKPVETVEAVEISDDQI
jgi:hypothetical protein